MIIIRLLMCPVEVKNAEDRFCMNVIIQEKNGGFIHKLKNKFK